MKVNGFKGWNMGKVCRNGLMEANIMEIGTKIKLMDMGF